MMQRRYRWHQVYSYNCHSPDLFVFFMYLLHAICLSVILPFLFHKLLHLSDTGFPWPPLIPSTFFFQEQFFCNLDALATWPKYWHFLIWVNFIKKKWFGLCSFSGLLYRLCNLFSRSTFLQLVHLLPYPPLIMFP